MSKNRKGYIEILRIFACFFVLFNHSAYSITHFSIDDVTKSRIVALVLFYICKTSVPIFILIFGANLLSKTDTKIKYLLRMVRTFSILLVASFFYYCSGHYFSFFEFLQGFYLGEYGMTLWYLYLYIGLLLILPLLRCCKFNTEHYYWMFALCGVGSGLVPIMAYYFDFQIPNRYVIELLPSSYIILTFMGDFLENKLCEKYYCLKGTIIAFFISIVFILLSIYLSLHHLRVTGMMDVDDMYAKIYYFPTIVISMCIYYIFKNIFRNINSRFITEIGKCTLGIYLLGDWLRLRFEFFSDYLKSIMSELLSVIVYDIVVFLVGLSVVELFYLGVKLLAKGVIIVRRK